MSFKILPGISSSVSVLVCHDKFNILPGPNLQTESLEIFINIPGARFYFGGSIKFEILDIYIVLDCWNSANRSVSLQFLFILHTVWIFGWAWGRRLALFSPWDRLFNRRDCLSRINGIIDPSEFWFRWTINNLLQWDICADIWETRNTWKPWHPWPSLTHRVSCSSFSHDPELF